MRRTLVNLIDGTSDIPTISLVRGNTTFNINSMNFGSVNTFHQEFATMLDWENQNSVQFTNRSSYNGARRNTPPRTTTTATARAVGRSRSTTTRGGRTETKASKKPTKTKGSIFTTEKAAPKKRAPKKGKEVPIVPYDGTNYYLGFTDIILDKIIREHDAHIVGTPQEKAEQLFVYDEVMSDWINVVRNCTAENFHRRSLTWSQLRVFAKLNNEDITQTSFDKFQASDIIDYLRITLLRKDPKHHQSLVRPLIFSVSDEVIKIFKEELLPYRLRRSKFVSREVICDAILNNNEKCVDHALLETYENRHRMIVTLPPDIQNLLCLLYEVSEQESGYRSGSSIINEEKKWIKVTLESPHALEDMIINMQDYALNDLVDTLGMCIPMAASDRLELYVRNNLPHYKYAVSRSEHHSIFSMERLYTLDKAALNRYFRVLTDRELLDNLGVYIDYKDRPSLVDRACNIIFSHKTFLVPLDRTAMRTQNKETVVMSTDVTDDSIFMVGFGRPHSYYCYELEDLISAFYKDPNGEMEFRKPNKIGRTFKIEQITQLKSLLGCYPRTRDIERLFTVIDETLIEKMEKTQYDEGARIALRKFTLRDKGYINTFLKEIFFAGMYMRRWKGPGHPYPTKRESTKVDYLPDAEVSDKLQSATRILDSMTKQCQTYCLGLNICEYKDTGQHRGNIMASRNKFRMLWVDVKRGVQCIRIASSQFVGTSYHYLRVLFHETMEGLNVAELDHIA